MILNAISEYNETSITMDIVGIEGGEVNDPNDHGGDTKYGVTIAAANLLKAELVARYQWDGTMEGFTVPMSLFVYHTNYWRAMNLDAILAIHPLLAHKLMDIGVNEGTGASGMFLQTALNTLNKNATWYQDIPVDGGIGPTTVGALRSYLANRGQALGVWHLLMMLTAQQCSRYIAIAVNNHTQEAFEDGWQDRGANFLAHYAYLLGHH